MAAATHQIARIFALLESINFGMIRDEFESASSWTKIAAGEDALGVAVDITRKFVPPWAITVSDLLVLTAILKALGEAAVDVASPDLSSSLPDCSRTTEESDFGPEQTEHMPLTSSAYEPLNRHRPRIA